MVMVPVLASFILRKGAKEWRNPVMESLPKVYRLAVTWCIRHRWLTLGVAMSL